MIGFGMDGDVIGGPGNLSESGSGGYTPSWFEKALMSFYNNQYVGNSSLLGKNQSIMGQKTAANPTGAVTVMADELGPTAPGHGPQISGGLMGPLGGPTGHGAQMTGGIVGNPGQPLGMTSGGYVNSPYGEFGPQYGMGYATPNSPYGEFGPSQPGGYNMSGNIDGGGERPWWLENMGGGNRPIPVDNNGFFDGAYYGNTGPSPNQPPTNAIIDYPAGYRPRPKRRMYGDWEGGEAA
jgi:hypothetical protein